MKKTLWNQYLDTSCSDSKTTFIVIAEGQKWYYDLKYSFKLWFGVVYVIVGKFIIFE